VRRGRSLIIKLTRYVTRKIVELVELIFYGRIEPESIEPFCHATILKMVMKNILIEVISKLKCGKDGYCRIIHNKGWLGFLGRFN